MLIARPQTDDLLDPCLDEQRAANWLLLDVGVEAELSLMSELVRSAMDRIESLCKQPIFERKFYGFGDSFCDTQLPSLNVTAVEKVEYRAFGSQEWLVLDASQYDWTVNGEIRFLPAVRSMRAVAQIRVSYTAGYAVVPSDILMAVRLLIGRWYEIRADEKREVPSHAEWLIKNYVMPIL